MSSFAAASLGLSRTTSEPSNHANEEFVDEEEEDRDCLLCAEIMDETDLSFRPCRCGFRLCLWCWHRLSQEDNARCPGCRTVYDLTAIAQMSQNPLNRKDIKEKVEMEKKKIRRGRSNENINTVSNTNTNSNNNPTRSASNLTNPSSAPASSSTSSSSLSATSSASSTLSGKDLSAYENVRVLQRNLLYVQGLTAQFAKEELLRKREYFGRFGRIMKVTIARKKLINTEKDRDGVNVYITYKKGTDVEEAIKLLNNTPMGGNIIRCTYGTTKYCANFLRSLACNNSQCFFLHEFATAESVPSSAHPSATAVNIANSLSNTNIPPSKATTGSSTSASASTSTSSFLNGLTSKSSISAPNHPALLKSFSETSKAVHTSHDEQHPPGTNGSGNSNGNGAAASPLPDDSEDSWERLHEEDSTANSSSAASAPVNHAPTQANAAVANTLLKKSAWNQQPNITGTSAKSPAAEAAPTPSSSSTTLPAVQPNNASGSAIDNRPPGFGPVAPTKVVPVESKDDFASTAAHSSSAASSSSSSSAISSPSSSALSGGPLSDYVTMNFSNSLLSSLPLHSIASYAADEQYLDERCWKVLQNQNQSSSWTVDLLSNFHSYFSFKFSSANQSRFLSPEQDAKESDHVAVHDRARFNPILDFTQISPMMNLNMNMNMGINMNMNMNLMPTTVNVQIPMSSNGV